MVLRLGFTMLSLHVRLMRQGHHWEQDIDRRKNGQEALERVVEEAADDKGTPKKDFKSKAVSGRHEIDC